MNFGVSFSVGFSFVLFMRQGRNRTKNSFPLARPLICCRYFAYICVCRVSQSPLYMIILPWTSRHMARCLWIKTIHNGLWLDYETRSSLYHFCGWWLCCLIVLFCFFFRLFFEPHTQEKQWKINKVLAIAILNTITQIILFLFLLLTHCRSIPPVPFSLFLSYYHHHHFHFTCWWNKNANAKKNFDFSFDKMKRKKVIIKTDHTTNTLHTVFCA